MQRITDNVYVETGFHGCNTSFVVTREGVVLIDTPMVPAEAKKWREIISRFGEVRYVINGEPHTDHVSGNCYLGGKVIAHEGTRQSMLSASAEALKQSLGWMAPDALPLDPEFRYRLPDITLSERLTLYLGDHTFQLIHMPGHSPFQVIVYVPEEKTVFTSDNVSRMPIFISAVPYEWLDSLKQMQQLDIDKVVPGHGEVSGKDYLYQMSEAVKYWIDSVVSAISKGMSLEEILEKVTLSDRYPAMAGDAQMNQMRRSSLARLYAVLKK
jgi:cyclase